MSVSAAPRLLPNQTQGQSAGKTFGKQVLALVHDEDLEQIVATQNKTLVAFRRTNQTLGTFNEFSAKRYADLQRQFDAHTRMLVAMKTDLDSIFRRIRTLQVKLGKQYPRAFEEVTRA